MVGACSQYKMELFKAIGAFVVVVGAKHPEDSSDVLAFAAVSMNLAILKLRLEMLVAYSQSHWRLVIEHLLCQTHTFL
jgi:hypothetical protein